MTLYGRDAELTAIDEVLQSARAGRGRALFVIGEAGIGKSSMLTEARVHAQGVVFGGAAWESPGAPPYWPWIQVLRAAQQHFGARLRSLPGAGLVSNLLAEWPAERASADDADPAAARFALIDAVASTLVVLSAEQPLLIVLDDLHAADLPSLELLELLCHELPRAAIALVGGYRDAELAGRPDAAKRLARASRHAVVCALQPLSADEVIRWVGPNGAAIHATTEGNPLFVEEMLRAQPSGGSAHGLASVLEDHLALVTGATRAVLAAASVLGREFDPQLLRTLCELNAGAVEHALQEATVVGLGAARSERWVFRHILLRDHLYASLAHDRRRTLHRAAGQALACAQPGSTQAAHQLLAGIEQNAVGPAVAAARAAATRAVQIHAFEDATSLLAAALRALEAVPSADVSLRIDLRLELARARSVGGAIETGKAEAMLAADLARAARDAERFARAVLVYATELASGRRDALMIELLEEALAGLPSADSPLLARVTARLCAALSPPAHTDKQPLFELADRAIAMADRLGDDEARLFTRRYAVHAYGLVLANDASLQLVQEIIAISDQIQRPLEALDQRVWLVNARLIQGDLAAADAATEELAALLAPLPQPHYRWRMPIIQATRATLRGDFDQAERLIESARQLARDHELDRARICCRFASVSLALVSRSSSRASDVIEDARTLARTGLMGWGPGLVASVLAVAGRLDEARTELSALGFLPPVGLSQFAAEAALILGDRAVTAKALVALTEAATRTPIAYGPSLSLVLCPIDVVIGEGLLLLERADDAIERLERGLALARALSSPPCVARATAALSSALAARGRSADRERLALLRAEAGTLSALNARDAAATTVIRAAPALEVARDGEMIRIRWRARELRQAPTKGLDYLAALVMRPNGEIHVSDLAGDEDRGDAGEVLDATARAAYKARVDELRAELDEAQARHDLGRIDRLNAELEAVTDQLVAGTGLGGRARRAGSRIERARINVQRRIRDAIRKLANEDPALGRYLDATIQTGTFCTFTPLEG